MVKGFGGRPVGGKVLVGDLLAAARVVGDLLTGVKYSGRITCSASVCRLKTQITFWYKSFLLREKHAIKNLFIFSDI